MTSSRPFERLPDQHFSWPRLAAPVRAFSRAHLRAGNVRAGSPDAALVRQLRDLADRDRAAGTNLDRYVDALAEAIETGRPADIYTLGWMIRRGHLMGLSAPWGIDRDADLLWAASARALDLLDAEHVNDVLDRAKTPTGSDT